MVHALHPNYAERHEDDHQPKLHEGLVIKYNANQRYATNTVTAFLFKEVAKVAGVPT
jgi:aspartyl aminopeptidase